MRKEFLRFLIGFLTFTIGSVGADFYRDYQIRRDYQMWQESKLRKDLHSMRFSIDEYATDKKELPQSLDDLVKANYLGDVPYDPVARRSAWKIVVSNDLNSLKGNQGIVDIHSTSSAISSEGTAYDAW